MFKKFLVFLAFIAVVSITSAQGIMDYQQHLERTAQAVLDKILGEGQSIIYIYLNGEPEKWQVKYTDLPEINGLDVTGGGGGNVAPGIPSLKFLSGGGDNKVPLNYEVTQLPPSIKTKDIILVTDKNIKAGELRSARNFITNFMDLDEKKGDKLTILRESFSNLERTTASKGKQTVTARGQANWLLVFVIVVSLIAVVVLFVFLYKKLKGKDKGSLKDKPVIAETKNEEDTSKNKSQDDVELEKEEEQRRAQEEKIQEMNKNILGNGERYFNFIDEENINKLRFLLQVKIALQQASPRTISVVMACLPFKLAASILIEYPPKIQSEIVNHLLFLQHYPEKEMEALELEIKENINYLYAGKDRLKLIIERLTGEDKKKILSLVEDKYPGIVDELNSLIFLFEDLLMHETKILARVFGDIDTEVIATSLVHMPSELQKKVITTLPKGVQSMVDQWLSMKANSATKYNVEQARMRILNYAQHLEREGFIELNHG